MVKLVCSSKSEQFVSILNCWLNYDLKVSNNKKAVKTAMKSNMSLCISFKDVGYTEGSFRSFFKILKSVCLFEK